MNRFACAPETLTACAVLRPGGLALTDEALGRCSLPRGARVLDVGCGAGAAVAYMRLTYGYRCLGIDPVAQGRYCLRARAESLPVKDGVCDCVLAECVLSLLPDPERSVREMRRVLMPSGWAVISDVYDTSMPDLPQQRMARCGLGVIFWQDRTRSLREFAAARALRGQPCADLLPPGLHPRQAGYYLMIARKEAG